MRALLLLMVPALLMAQGGAVVSIGRPAPGPQYAPEDLGSVAGQVVNSITGEPVRKGALQLSRIGSTSGTISLYSAQSDNSGKFLLDKVVPGKYRLNFNRTGFVNSSYSGELGGAFSAITLDRAQKVTGLVFRVTPNGVVTGRVVDEDGDPVVRAQVQLSRFRRSQGRMTLSSSNSTTTNDLGEYRVFDVSPGKYRVRVTPQRNSALGAADANGREEYVPIYYPGVFDFASSVELDVPAGAQLQNINIRIMKLRTVHVRGRVSLVRQDGPQGSAVTLTSADLLGSSSAGVDRQGNFDVASVVPGSYTLAVLVNQGGKPPYSVRQPLQVGASGVEGLSITVPPPVSLTGRVRVEGNDPITMKSLRVSMQPQDAMGLRTGNESATPGEDGAFRIENISPDRYTVNLSGALGNRYLKSIRAGGVDALTNGLDLSQGSPGEIEIVLGANAGRIGGVVNGEKPGQPLAGVLTVLIPQARELRDRTATYKLSMSGEDGRFAFSGIAPGDYKVFAWDQPPERIDYTDPDFVKSVEDKGQAVTIREGDRLDLQVTAIPSAPTGY